MDSFAPLTLVALASGYLFTTRFHLTSYQAERASGYHLLFQSTCWGIALIAFSQVMLLTGHRILPGPVSSVQEGFRSLAPVDGAAPFAVAFVLSFIIIPGALNLTYSKERAARRVIVRRGSEFEKLLYDSQASLLPVSITLKNEKVYVGWPVYTPEPRRRLQDVRILPAASGYRDPVTKELSLRTEYVRVYERLREGSIELEPRDFEIVLPLEEVRSANQFSLDIDQEIFRVVSQP